MRLRGVLAERKKRVSMVEKARISRARILLKKTAILDFGVSGAILLMQHSVLRENTH